MKNTGFFTAICFLVLFSGCTNALLVQPSLKPGSSAGGGDVNLNGWGAPNNVKVSHGQKKQVSLAWEPVRGAVKYSVHSSDSPFTAFIPVKETTSAEAIISERSGIIKYYKVYAVDKYGKQSDASAIVTGSSLGVPQITNIARAPDLEASSLIVEWLMPNIGNGTSTYEDKVIYTVYYVDSTGAKKEAGKVDAKKGGAEQLFTVEGLNPLTDYSFVIAAALDSEPDATEESFASNMATVQKMKPDKPADLKAEQGINKDKIILTWTCPANVELPKKDAPDEYESTPLFFRVYRKKSGAAEYAFLAEKKAPTGTAFAEGDVITFEDTAAPEDAKYDYKVQSFADNAANPSTSKLAVAETTGWRLRLIQKFNRTITNNYETNESGVKVVTGLTITFKADWSNFGNEAPYAVSLLEEKSIGDSTFPAGSKTAVTENLGFADGLLINTATGEPVKFAKTIAPGTSEYYRYTLKISRDGVTVLEKLGSHVVVAEVPAPTAEFTAVTDGYSDKAVFEWKYQQGTEYTLRVRPTADSTQSTDYPVAFTADPSDDETVTYELTGLANNTDYEIALYANNGVTAESDYEPVTTLGIPQVTVTAYDSKSVTLSWAKVKGGHAGSSLSSRLEHTAGYTLKYEKKTTDSANAVVTSTETVDISTITQGADGLFTYKLTLPDDHALDGFASGTPFTVTVAATSLVSAAPKPVEARLVGPALAQTTATEADTDSYFGSVAVSWNAISGAQSYYVDRKSVTDGETDRYVVSSTGVQWKVEVCNPMGNEPTPLQVITNGTKFTLIDKATTKPSVEMNLVGKPKNYADRQATMRWGKKFEYSVLPYCGEDLEYTKIDKKIGYVFGYATNIHATKAKNSKSVTISWEHPDVPADMVKPQYKVLRRSEMGTDDWSELESSFMTGSSYTDSTALNKVGYRYLVVARSSDGKVSSPKDDPAFETNFGKESFTEYNISDEPLNVGYKLATPVFTPTRKELKNATGAYGIEVNWDVNVSGKYNRGIKEYKLEIQNNNIDSTWYGIESGIAAAQQSYDRSYYTDSAAVTPSNGKNLMKVLRDYKINFRITAIGDGEGNTAPGENWGARQITDEEFAVISSLSVSTALHKGMIQTSEYETGYNRNITFTNARPFYLTIKGLMKGGCSATAQIPKQYGAEWDGSFAWSSLINKPADLEVVGPSDVSLYSGRIIINVGDKTTNTVKVVYNNATTSFGKEIIPLNYGGYSYKDCTNLDWVKGQGWK